MAWTSLGEHLRWLDVKSTPPCLTGICWLCPCRPTMVSVCHNFRMRWWPFCWLSAGLPAIGHDGRSNAPAPP
eukprot:12882731-Prorocentrum_lima.AAC.1